MAMIVLNLWFVCTLLYLVDATAIPSFYEKNNEDNSLNVPTTWDIKFDCRIKNLAFEYAKKLSPGSGQDDIDLIFIFDALQLGAVCNETYPGFGAHNKHSYDKETTETNYNKNLEVFVDKNHGKKSYKGTLSLPLSDIQHGIDMCVSKLKQNKNFGRCVVYVRQGSYYISKAIRLASGVHLKSYKNEHVVISGHKTVKPIWKEFISKVDEFENYSPIFENITPKQSTKTIQYFGTTSSFSQCQNLCKTDCTSFVYFNESVKDFANQCYGRRDGLWNAVSAVGATSGKKIKIYSTDLSKEELSVVDQVFHDGGRYTRARFPNADPVIQGLHTNPTGYVPKAESWSPPKKYEDAVEIHIASPTRNASLFPAFQIGIGGPVSQFDPPQSYWGTKHPFGGGGSTYRVPSGLKYSKELEMNLRSWKNPSTGFVHTFQNLHWENWVFNLDERNEEEQTLKWTRGGFQGARGSNSGGEWYVENIFEELDVANEWFYNESTKTLYLMPNLTDSQRLPEEIQIPQIPTLFLVVGSQNKPVKDVVISDFTFEGTTTTYMEPYMVPSGGDWTVHPNAIGYIEGTEDVTVTRCTFHSPGGNGLFVFNYNRNTIISHNTMFKLGDNGIVLVGEARLIDGSVGNQPRGTQVLYNTITENGIWGKQTYPFVQSVSCETTLKGNVFFSGPRAGLNFNDGFGGGNVVESNLLFNFVRETDDHGPINTWDRVPYLTKVGDGKTLSLDVKENSIHNNFIINNYRSVWPIDHDDGTCFWRDTYNFLVYGGFKNYLGHDKISDHNIYVYPDRHPDKEAFSKLFCADTAGQTLGTSGYNDVYTNNICVIGSENIYFLGSCDSDPKKLPSLIPHFAHNQIFTPNATVTIKCKDEVWDLEEAQAHGIDVNTKVSKLPSDDEIIQWGKDLFGL